MGEMSLVSTSFLDIFGRTFILLLIKRGLDSIDESPLRCLSISAESSDYSIFEDTVCKWLPSTCPPNCYLFELP